MQLSTTEKLKPYIQSEPAVLRSPENLAAGLVTLTTLSLCLTQDSYLEMLDRIRMAYKIYNRNSKFWSE